MFIAADLRVTIEPWIDVQIDHPRRLFYSLLKNERDKSGWFALILLMPPLVKGIKG